MELSKSKFELVPEDMERSIEPASDRDRVSRRRHRSSGGEQLDVLSIQRDGIIVIDVASGFKAEDVGQVDTLGGAMNIGQMVVLGKAGIVIVEIGAFEKSIGVVDGGNVVAAESLNEAVLMSTVGAFNAALGLG